MADPHLSFAPQGGAVAVLQIDPLVEKRHRQRDAVLDRDPRSPLAPFGVGHPGSLDLDVAGFRRELKRRLGIRRDDERLQGAPRGENGDARAGRIGWDLRREFAGEVRPGLRPERQALSRFDLQARRGDRAERRDDPAAERARGGEPQLDRAVGRVGDQRQSVGAGFERGRTGRRPPLRLEKRRARRKAAKVELPFYIRSDPETDFPRLERNPGLVGGSSIG